jgi:hypothetical protein
MTLPTLKKRLKERGLLATMEKHQSGGREVERCEVRRTLQGKRRWVLHLNATSLGHTSTESEPSEPHGPPEVDPYLADPEMAHKNGAHSEFSPEFVSHKSGPRAGGGVSGKGDDGSPGSLGSQTAREEGQADGNNPGRDPWEQFLEEASEP